MIKLKNLTPFQKRYTIIFSILTLLFLLFLILIFIFPSISTVLFSDLTKNTSRSGWPSKVAAPYIDMSSWVNPTNAYSDNGAPNLKKLSEDGNIKYFNLGFIQPDSVKPLETDGTIRWGWGGYYSLSKNGTDTAQYNGILNSLSSLRESGGDYCISIGGQLGDAPWVVTQNQNALENFYKDVIQTYDLKRMDLDIEESNQDYNQNIINAKAIKAVQDETNIEITLTIPIMPFGWEQKQINIIKAYLDAGVDIETINSMTMCYGTGVNPGEDYGWASIRAMRNAFAKIKEIFANYGFALTDEQAYGKLGATYSIGYESNLYPVFTKNMSQTIVNDAKENKYGLVSFWSINRDAKLEQNSGINDVFEYCNILNEYNKSQEQ